MLTFDHTLAV